MHTSALFRAAQKGLSANGSGEAVAFGEQRGLSVHVSLDRKRGDLRDLCRRFGVARLDVFGSAARGVDFDEAASDVDFLVEFEATHDDLARSLDFHDALEALFGRTVDLVDRKAVEASRNYIRRRLILTGAESVYAA